jgi:hypothetical protein
MGFLGIGRSGTAAFAGKTLRPAEEDGRARVRLGEWSYGQTAAPPDVTWWSSAIAFAWIAFGNGA